MSCAAQQGETSRAREVPDGTAGREPAVPSAGEQDDGAKMPDAGGGASDDADAATVEEGAYPSSTATFLADLERLSASPEEDAASSGAQDVIVIWHEEAGLVDLAKRVLEPYEAVGAELVTAGYLDLAGNVWGAVVATDAWVDVAVISCDEQDAISTARVSRLLPAVALQGSDEDGGG